MLYIKHYLRYIHNIKDYSMRWGLRFRSPLAMRGRRALSAAADILLRWGLRFRSPLAMRGRRALAAAADRRQPQKQQHKKKKAAGSCCCCWLLLRWGASLPLASGHAGEESPRRPNSRTAEQPEQLPPLPSASPSPVRFRPASPSASV